MLVINDLSVGSFFEKDYGLIDLTHFKNIIEILNEWKFEVGGWKQVSLILILVINNGKNMSELITD